MKKTTKQAAEEIGLSKELCDALERCDLLIGEDTIDYYYELYDPKTGGFYYSISSRDLEGATPFAEGTCFVQESLMSMGLTFPDWYKEKVGSWIRGHQDESDGYFYEELWGKSTSGPRLNRDLNYSKGILKRCGMTPAYPTPDERITSKDAAPTDIPEYLQSPEKIKAYMDSMDWSTSHIWGTGQALAMAKSLIVAAGLYDTVYDYIVSKQNPETGLWGEGLGWMNTNGAMKLSSFFCDKAHPCPNLERVIESVKALFKSGIPAEHATYIWNPFVLITNALNSVDGDDAEKMRAKLIECGADIVNFAVDSALKLKRADGGFSSNLDRAQSHQQGFLYGLGLKDESDIDGTVIAGHRLRAHICKTFGVKAPEDYYTELNDDFWEKCKNKAPVKKLYATDADFTKKYVKDFKVFPKDEQ